jgi:hypothetical protein
MIQITDDERRRAFRMWLRTGQLLGAIELKYNHWHDPANGRFTFSEWGHYHGAREAGPTNRALGIVNRDSPGSRGSRQRRALKRRTNRRVMAGGGGIERRLRRGPNPIRSRGAPISPARLPNLSEVSAKDFTTRRNRRSWERIPR